MNDLWGAAGGMGSPHLNPAHLTQCQGSSTSPNCLTLSSPTSPGCCPHLVIPCRGSFICQPCLSATRHVRQLQ